MYIFLQTEKFIFGRCWYLESEYILESELIKHHMDGEIQQ